MREAQGHRPHLLFVEALDELRPQLNLRHEPFEVTKHIILAAVEAVFRPF